MAQARKTPAKRTTASASSDASQTPALAVAPSTATEPPPAKKSAPAVAPSPSVAPSPALEQSTPAAAPSPAKKPAQTKKPARAKESSQAKESPQAAAKKSNPKRAKATITPQPGFGRIPVTNISPVIEMGEYPAKAVVGELLPIRATVFREGHDAVNASIILTNPAGVTQRIDMEPTWPTGLDPWLGWIRPDSEGAWSFRIEGWSDPWETWKHNADAKLNAAIDIPLVCAEGRALLQRTIESCEQADESAILAANIKLLSDTAPCQELLEVVHSNALQRVMKLWGPREFVSPTREYPLQVDRKRALFSAWYEFFPRSIGASYDAKAKKWTSGNFDSCHTRLEEVAEMGFDVVYLPPVHPIGAAFRKGKNNTLTASTQDPGSPWAIGNADGGHDAIHPDLGDWDAFDRFVAKAKSLDMEVALDLALQCSPDHPWVREHPQWFSKRIDGTIAYAENPPKKYQDIYPLNFDNDPAGIYAEILRILKLWMSHGVRIFRVDNPHTKPIPFWSWILDQIRQSDPDVLFLAEAFTKPAMMSTLGKVGFHQSYTYFTWRNEKWELEEYLGELSTQMADFYRPNFFVNTPDINPFFLQNGNPAAFAIRAILAATLSPSWGVYSGFELFEHEPLAPGREEYRDSEKYEYRPRDFQAEPNLNVLLKRLNQIRRDHPALQQLRSIHFHHAAHDQVIVYSKKDADDTVLVVCSLNPDWTLETQINLDLEVLGVPGGFAVQDELSGAQWTWYEQNFVRLTPATPAHILRVFP